MSAISRGADWDFDLLERYDKEISRIAGDYGLDTYPNQIEVITSEQMLDAYASSGLPIAPVGSSSMSGGTAQVCVRVGPRDWSF